jgi:hypothetical protein
MLNLDQVEKELRALDRFDDMFLTEVEPTLEDMIGLGLGTVVGTNCV